METICVQKILVPIDFSEASLNALNTAIFMAKRQHAQIILIHIVNISNLIIDPDHDIIYDPNLENILEEHLRKIRKLADSITNEHFIDCRAFIRTGKVVCSEIIRAAVDFYSDLVVVGTHGTSPIKEYFIGSNSMNLIKNSPCPVLTVPPNKKFERFKTILFPIRPIKGALEKYDLAKNIIRENKAELIVVGLLENTEKESFEVLNLEALTLNKKLKEDELKAQSYFYYCNDVAQKTLEKVKDFNADLLIITATLDHQIQDYFIGPFTYQIIQNATVPVLSIRPKPSDLLEVESINENNLQYPTEMNGLI